MDQSISHDTIAKIIRIGRIFGQFQRIRLRPRDFSAPVTFG